MRLALGQAHAAAAQGEVPVGAVVTGSEIYSGLIPDGFDTWVGEKIRACGSGACAACA